MKFENVIIYVFYGVLTTLINYVSHFGLRLALTDFGRGYPQLFGGHGGNGKFGGIICGGGYILMGGFDAFCVFHQ